MGIFLLLLSCPSVESFLKTLFIVSDASLVDEGSLGTSSPEWTYSDSIPIMGNISSTSRELTP